MVYIDNLYDICYNTCRYIESLTTSYHLSRPNTLSGKKEGDDDIDRTTWTFSIYT